MLTVYTDGACRVSNPGLCASGFVVYGHNGMEIHRSARVLDGLNTNNVAEYTAVLDALRWAKEQGCSVEISCDSQLVVKQLNLEWIIKHEALVPLGAEAYELLHETNSRIKWVRGHNGDPGNEDVDLLCNETLDEFQGRTDVK